MLYVLIVIAVIIAVAVVCFFIYATLMVRNPKFAKKRIEKSEAKSKMVSEKTKQEIAILAERRAKLNVRGAKCEERIAKSKASIQVLRGLRARTKKFQSEDIPALEKLKRNNAFTPEELHEISELESQATSLTNYGADLLTRADTYFAESKVVLERLLSLSRKAATSFS